MPQLDALRAFAVLGVLASHFCRGTPALAPAGHLGVRLFFVLSGFLITGILLRCRTLVDDGQDAGFTLRRFYARRALRIAPLYYAVLLVTWLAGVPETRAALWWHVAYLSNAYFTLTGAWQGPLSHLWSLAVEEQFYLVWPALVLWVPRQRLRHAVIAVAAVGPLYRAVGELAGLPIMALWTMPFVALDAFGLGALLALHEDESRVGVGAAGGSGPGDAQGARSRFPHWLWWATTMSLPALLWCLGGWTSRPAPLLWVMDHGLAELMWTAVFGALVLGAARGFRGWPGRVLTWPPLAYVGRVSYGVYVIHLFVPLFVPRALAAVGLEYPTGEGLQFVYLTGASVALAALSWSLYERPINALKRRLPYAARAAQPSTRRPTTRAPIVSTPAGMDAVG